MPRYELDLRLDAPSGEPSDLGNALTEESQQVRARLYRELGLKVHSAGWVSVDPGSDKGLRTIQRLIEMSRSGRAFAGAGTLWERPDQSDITAADWFQLATDTAPHSFSLWDDYPCYKAGSHPKGHALNHTFVSAAFVEACVRSRLIGVSFVRCKNKGRKRVQPWFVALPDRSLGHGLDHPWLDRKKWLCEVSSDRSKRSSSLDTAQSSFHQRWLREDLGPDGHLLKSLLELFPDRTTSGTTLMGLKFVTVPRYWTKVFPDADFAYIPWGEDGPNREGKILRFRLLMASRRGRQALIDAGLFAEKAFLPVRSVAVPEEGVEILDQLHSPVPPMYTPDELTALRMEEKRVLAAESR
jgi:hypothetical protein